MTDESLQRGRSRGLLRDPRFAVVLLLVGVVVFLGGIGAFGGGPSAPVIQQPFVDGFDDSLFGQPGRSGDAAIDSDLLELYGSADASGEHADPFSRRD